MKASNEDICLEYEERHWIAYEELLKLIKEKYVAKECYSHLLEGQEIYNILNIKKQ